MKNKSLVKQQYQFLERVTDSGTVYYDDESEMWSIDGDIRWTGNDSLDTEHVHFPAPLELVTGTITITKNKYIRSLDNLPLQVRSLYLTDLPALDDFSNMPKIVYSANFKHLPLLKDLKCFKQFDIENITISNCGVTSLEGCPNIIKECLILTSNSKLKTLKSGSPIEIGHLMNCSFSALESLDHDGITILGNGIVMRGMPKLVDCTGLYSINLNSQLANVHIEGSEHVRKEVEIWKKMKLFCDFS